MVASSRDSIYSVTHSIRSISSTASSVRSFFRKSPFRNIMKSKTTSSSSPPTSASSSTASKLDQINDSFRSASSPTTSVNSFTSTVTASSTPTSPATSFNFTNSTTNKFNSTTTSLLPSALPRQLKELRLTPSKIKSSASSNSSIESFEARIESSSSGSMDGGGGGGGLDGVDCPVCLESLSLRLAGEKAHVVPVCGHRLHATCYENVYGGTPRQRGVIKSLGVCGVCRREMRLSEEGHSSGRNKFAAMAGLPQTDKVESHKLRSISRHTLDPYEEASLHDPTEDDDLVVIHLSSTFPSPTLNRSPRPNTASTLTGRSTPIDTPGEYGIVRPVVTVRSEHASVARSRVAGKTKNLTCMVTILMPSRWPTPMPTSTASSSERDEGYGSTRLGGSSNLDHSTPRATRSELVSSPTSPASESSYSPSTTTTTTTMASNPFLSVIEDLQHRMQDWKGHSLEEFGALKLYDYINVRKDKNVREFLVYLFDEAILCVADDQRKGFASKLVDGIAGPSDKLRLKGRIYLRHVRSISDTSRGSDLTLTVKMQDDTLDEFVMAFKTRASLEVWRSQIELLLSSHYSSPPFPTPPPAPSSGMAHRSMNGSLYNGRSPDNRSETGSTRSGGHTSIYSSFSRTTSSSAPPLAPSIPEEDAADLRSYSPSSSSTYSNRYTSTNSPLGARDFTSLDLMLILSISSSSALKLGIIRSTIDFIVQTVGPRTRISVVTFVTGDGHRGVLRKTPFIAVGRPESRRRLDLLIDNLGSEYAVGMTEHNEESVNVVTAVNLALDIVLQRKTKSAVSGMLLMNDGKDGAHKQQMDLAMTRVEAANIPIHTIGWGPAHDPSSLWLLSNHTKGTYTFVREYYELRDTVAGIVGGMLSIAATNVRLHISVPERRWFRIRKVAGTSGAIVSADGKDVDIDVGELRYGERKDLIVEVEMEMDPPHEVERSQPSFSSATDEFFMKVGLDPLALGDSPQNFYEKEYEGMATEVPLFEVNAAYRDPAAGRNISRLTPSPCLLTISVVPPLSPGSPSPHTVSDPTIVRRRMELLTSDMLTRTLLLMSRHNESQAQRLLVETKRIISTIADTLVTNSSSHTNRSSPHGIAHATLLSCAEDVSHVLEGISNRQLFESSHRNYAAQQAVVLREQRSWGAKSRTEALMWKADNSLFFATRSQNWLSSR